ncbi:hypothetical protein D3C71_1423150 [compost metagenome]
MDSRISTIIEQPPAFLSAVLMVTDDERRLQRGLIQAERKSPPRYTAARDHLLRVLQGQISFTFALSQARKIAKVVDRRCAVDVMEALEPYLNKQGVVRIERLAAAPVEVLEGLSIDVGPIWVAHSPDAARLFVCHLWESPLSDWQLGVAGRLIKAFLRDHYVRYAGLEIDFICASLSDLSRRRGLRVYGWERLDLLVNDQDEERFWKRFKKGWIAYKSAPPRIYRVRQGGLFNRGGD